MHVGTGIKALIAPIRAIRVAIHASNSLFTCPVCDSTTGMYRERKRTDFHWKLWPRTVRNGTDDNSERNGTERISFRNRTERNGFLFAERNGSLFWTERNGTQPPNVNPDQKNGVVTKTFAPKFRSEPSDREVHSSYGDYFRDYFCVYVSGQLSGNFCRIIYGGGV